MSRHPDMGHFLVVCHVTLTWGLGGGSIVTIHIWLFLRKLFSVADIQIKNNRPTRINRLARINRLTRMIYRSGGPTADRDGYSDRRRRTADIRPVTGHSIDLKPDGQTDKRPNGQTSGVWGRGGDRGQRHTWPLPLPPSSPIWIVVSKEIQMPFFKRKNQFS